MPGATSWYRRPQAASWEELNAHLREGCVQRRERKLWGHQETIAERFHPRSYGREEMIFNPLHYLALLEQKSNALDQAAPLEGMHLPEEFLEPAAADGGARGWANMAAGASTCRCCACWRPFRLRKWRRRVRQALRFPADHRLRCGEASSAVRHRAAAAETGPG